MRNNSFKNEIAERVFKPQMSPKCPHSILTPPSPRTIKNIVSGYQGEEPIIGKVFFFFGFSLIEKRFHDDIGQLATIQDFWPLERRWIRFPRLITSEMAVLGVWVVHCGDTPIFIFKKHLHFLKCFFLDQILLNAFKKPYLLLKVWYFFN